MKVKIGTSGNLFWALCEIIGKDWGKGKELVQNAEKDDDGYIFDIELKIDGVEFDFSNVINQLISSQNEIVEKKVKERLKDKFYDIISKSNEIIENLDYINTKIEE